MKNPQKVMSWAIASSLSDYARGIKDISLRSLCYHGSHVSSASLRRYISSMRDYMHSSRFDVSRAQEIVVFTVFIPN